LSTDLNLPAVNDEIRELCHFRHMWDRVDSNHWTASRGDPLTLRCMRCGTEFRAQISHAGVYVTKVYVYPRGYLYGRTEHRLSHAERRALIVRQAIFNARKTRTTTKRRAS
jgi:uncharacterized C2H2 Zn-finger protein